MDRRMMKLAGLNESVGDSPETQSKITSLLSTAYSDPDMRNMAADVLEFIKENDGTNAGAITQYIKQLYPTVSNTDIGAVIKTFRAYVHRDTAGTYHWVESGTGGTPMYNAVRGQVDLAYTATEVLKDKGPLTLSGWVRAIADQSGLSTHEVNAYMMHAIDHNLLYNVDYDRQPLNTRTFWVREETPTDHMKSLKGLFDGPIDPSLFD